MTDMSAYTIRRIATSGCELLAPDGTVIAWAVDEGWAALIAGLLNRVEAKGLIGQGSVTRGEQPRHCPPRGSGFWEG